MLATSEEEHAEARFGFRRGSMLLLPRITPPAWLAETLVRLAAPVVGLLQPRDAAGPEARLRGMLLGWRFGVRGFTPGSRCDDSEPGTGAIRGPGSARCLFSDLIRRGIAGLSSSSLPLPVQPRMILQT
jgi:hypothetical protein